MIDYVIYGRIIIDKIYLPNGEVVENLLGGGSPQAAFGARVWSKSVGLLVRSGVDIPAEAVKSMQALDIDLSGWVKYPDLATTMGIPIRYDHEDYRIVDLSAEDKIRNFYDRFTKFHSRIIPIPESYRAPKVVHFLSDLPQEPMIESIFKLRETGAIVSLEPMIDCKTWSNLDGMLELIKKADIISPDWPSAAKVANEDSPAKVMRHWINMLSESPTQLISVRHGGNGSYVWDRNSDKIWHVPPIEIEKVDTTGCGNCFAGGLSVGWEKSRDARMAAASATASAMFMLQQVGMPVMSEKIEKQAVLWRDQILDHIKPI